MALHRASYHASKRIDVYKKHTHSRNYTTTTSTSTTITDRQEKKNWKENIRRRLVFFPLLPFRFPQFRLRSSSCFLVKAVIYVHPSSPERLNYPYDCARQTSALEVFFSIILVFFSLLFLYKHKYIYIYISVAILLNSCCICCCYSLHLLLVSFSQQSEKTGKM